MGYNFNRNVFDILNKIDLNEELDPSIDGEVLLYEDNEFSKTAQEADKYRTEVEQVFGCSITNNQADALARDWALFYRNALENEDLRDIIISKLDKDPATAFTDKLREEMENSNINFMDFDDEEEIDYEEDSKPDALHPNQEIRTMDAPVNSDFSPMQVQAWDTDSAPKSINSVAGQDNMSALNDMGNELVYDDVDDDFNADIDYSKINDILKLGQN